MEKRTFRADFIVNEENIKTVYGGVIRTGDGVLIEVYCKETPYRDSDGNKVYQATNGTYFSFATEKVREEDNPLSFMWTPTVGGIVIVDGVVESTDYDTDLL